ncbi:MAG TPA: HAD-IA family hydrolase [Candidatus Saccharimonadales bacterium]|nr:HAD-IA family hydrolase [Candidatus Saccharimonadales bacterium]
MIKAIIFDYFGVLANPSAAGWWREEPLLTYIRTELKPAYKIGLLSNVGKASFQTLFTPEERDGLFDATVVSGEVGISKPHPEIYKIACERLEVEPDEAIFVDDAQDNILGAEAIGMRTVLYRDFATFQRRLAETLQNTEQ